MTDHKPSLCSKNVDPISSAI